MRQNGCGTVVLSVCLFLFSSIPVAPQQITEAQVKAAFLYNFAKFVEWPEGKFAAPDTPMVICVMEDSAFATTVKETIDGRSINGRAVRVTAASIDPDLRNCNVLFVGSRSERQSAAILERVAGAHVLTVGDFKSFAQRGGMINFYVQDARVRFEINPAAAERARLRVSAKLLALARVVREAPTGK